MLPSMKIPVNLKFFHLLLFFLLITAGTGLPIQAQDALTEITLGTSEISFSDFSKIGSAYDTNIQGAFRASDDNDYSGWTKGSVKYVSASNNKVAQFKTSNDGWLTSPTITSKNGFKVTITYSSQSKPQLQIGSEATVLGPLTSSASDDGTGLEMSASTSATSTTFTITNIGANLLYVSKITITPNSSSSSGGEETKKNPDISFEQKSYTATLGQAFESPVLRNPNSLSGINYTSSETGVATVDNSGAVSLEAAGTTTITASFDGDDTYAAGTASYTLTVQQASTPTPTTFYKRITSTDEIVDGNVCLLYCDYSKLMASSYKTDKNWLNPSNTVTITNNSYTGGVNAKGLPYEITITKKEGSGTYALYTSEKYLTPSAQSTTFGTSNSPAYSWNISFNSNERIKISNSGETDRYICYNSSYFKNYKSGTLPWLYQKQTTLNLKDAAGGWATYYNKGFAYVMPQGVKGYYVTLDESKANLILTLAYDAGAAVPENTPLLLYGKVGTYNSVIVNKTITRVEDTNYMAGERDVDGYTSAGENMVYYKLTLDNNGNNIGFYYGADDGAPFVMKNETSAYLALPKEEAKHVRNLILDPDTLTRLSPIEQQKTPEALYDLSGRRIQHPQRGLYIQGGRVVYQK